MKIGVIGAGIVGRALARCYMEWAEVRVYDILKERATHSLVETLACDLIFVCLPESEVDDFFCARDLTHINYVLKSTVPIGTTRRLAERYKLTNLVHSPEFLTERCALVDAQTPARNIIGGPCCGCAGKLLELYDQRFPGVPTHLMSSDESEAVKLFCNGFFATKIAYFNECNALVEKLGLDWQRIMAGVLSDGRIAHAHTQVPGHDGRYGFGGLCLPKDLLQLVTVIREAGLSAAVTEAVSNRNLQDRERIRA